MIDNDSQTVLALEQLQKEFKTSLERLKHLIFYTEEWTADESGEGELC